MGSLRTRAGLLWKPKLKIRYPSGFEHAVHLTKQELEHHIRLMAALKMFELGKVSSGRAAELAGMSRIEFLETCGRYSVSPFNYSPEEAEEELKRDVLEARKRIPQCESSRTPAQS